MAKIEPPRSEVELLERAGALAGRQLGELADHLGVAPPRSARAGKGWAGQLIELILGASAGSLPEPDFQLISVELKTIPLNRRGRPAESTYVCMVPLTGTVDSGWRDSTVYRKLARVLWVPVEHDPEIRIVDRRIGRAVLWSPDDEQERALRTDWEELTEMVQTGRISQVDARWGELLQIRPKARDASIRTTAIGEQGQPVQANPRGFYLRPAFTARILGLTSDEKVI